MKRNEGKKTKEENKTGKRVIFSHKKIQLRGDM
jgi:hypothetical protein